jgi:hypothetical protein
MHAHPQARSVHLPQPAQEQLFHFAISLLETPSQARGSFGARCQFLTGRGGKVKKPASLRQVVAAALERICSREVCEVHLRDSPQKRGGMGMPQLTVFISSLLIRRPPGLNTLLLSASSGAPDIVALAGTLSNDGIVHLPSALGTGVFVVATFNLGASGQITASADTGGVTLPVTLTICQTNPATSVCLGTPAASAIATIATNATPTFAIFAAATNNVAPLYAANRISVRFTDTTSTVRGSTSVAVATQGYNPPLPPALNFTPTSPPPGVVGQPYAFSFCNPQPMPIATGPCGFPTQSNPIGGTSPYHFQLDSDSGFPPIGISLGIDGWLTGTPAAAGTSPFGVCAIDLNGSQVCVDTSVTATGPSGSVPTNLEPPVVSGTAQVGQVLASTTGTWTGATSYAYQWAGSGAPVAAATAATYTPVSSDVGHTLTSTVTATGSSGAAASATSGVPVLTAPLAAARLRIVTQEVA